MNSKEQIAGCEERLLQAVRNSDVATLDKLIHGDLIFVIPNGQTGTKADDLAAYQSGNMQVENISAGERDINIVDDTTAVVSVITELKGKYFDQPIDGKFRYLRVWKLLDDRWQIVAGSCTAVAE